MLCLTVHIFRLRNFATDFESVWLWGEGGLYWPLSSSFNFGSSRSNTKLTLRETETEVMESGTTRLKEVFVGLYNVKRRAS